MLQSSPTVIPLDDAMASLLPGNQYGSPAYVLYFFLSACYEGKKNAGFFTGKVAAVDIDILCKIPEALHARVR